MTGRLANGSAWGRPVRRQTIARFSLLGPTVADVPPRAMFLGEEQGLSKEPFYHDRPARWALPKTRGGFPPPETTYR